jgi:hypothetical protein
MELKRQKWIKKYNDIQLISNGQIKDNDDQSVNT